MKAAGARCATMAFLIAALAAALVPLVDRSRDARAATMHGFPGWPTTYEGRTLTELPLSPREMGFVRDFPGRVGRFSDGRREIIIRWVDAPTRRLHPAADCLRASGYRIVPMPARTDASGVTMSCVRASGPAGDMAVCEVIRDERGQSWPDVSAWYWHAMLGASPAPWWSFVVAEKSAP
jgi:hypothetical protein